MDGMVVAGVVAVVAAFMAGFGIGKMVGYEEGWEKAANTPPEQLALAKRLLKSLKDGR